MRDSSLSASIQAIVAAEVGHLDLAYAYFRETALIDLHDLTDNTAEGLHFGSLAGAWLVAVAGFGGFRDYGETLAFAPRLPPPLTRLGFRLLYRGQHLRVDIGADHARYELLLGEPLALLHYGELVSLTLASPQTRVCPSTPEVPPVEPPGRAPGRHGVGKNDNGVGMAVQRLQP